MMVSDEQRRIDVVNGAQSRECAYQAIFTPFIRGMLRVLLEFCVEKNSNFSSKVHCQPMPNGSVSDRTRRQIESRRCRNQRASALRNNDSSNENCK